MSNNPAGDLPESNAARAPDGRFAKGNHGGPGRPRRAVSEAASVFDQLAVEAARELIDVAIAQARKGNMAALKLVLERAWPVHRQRPVAIDAPVLARSDDFLPAQAALTNAVLNGEVSPNAGAVVASLLEEQQRRVRYLEICEERQREAEGGGEEEGEDES